MTVPDQETGQQTGQETGPDEVTGLEAMLCFDLYAASRAMTAAYRPLLAEHGLTYPQYLVLVALWARDDVAIKALAATLRLDHATLTPLLRRLEDRGLLTRSRGAGDARSVRVTLTSHGSDLQRIAPGLRCQVTDSTGLDPAELAGLQATLQRLTSDLDRRPSDSP